MVQSWPHRAVTPNICERCAEWGIFCVLTNRQFSREINIVFIVLHESGRDCSTTGNSPRRADQTDSSSEVLYNRWLNARGKIITSMYIRWQNSFMHSASVWESCPGSEWTLAEKLQKATESNQILKATTFTKCSILISCSNDLLNVARVRH